MPEPTPPLAITADENVGTVRELPLVLDGDLRVRRANRYFYQTFQVAREDTEDRLVYEHGNQQWDTPSLRELLEEVLPQNSFFNGFEVVHDFESVGRTRPAVGRKEAMMPGPALSKCVRRSMIDNSLAELNSPNDGK